MVGLSRKRVFPKTKGDSITGQDRAQKHCDFRFSQIEKKSKVAVLQLMHIMPRGHIETDPFTSKYLVTFSLEYPKGPCLIGILAQW